MQYEIKQEVLDLRQGLEEEYVSMAVSAVCRGHQTITDLTAICPVECVITHPSWVIYKAMAEMGEAGEVIKLPTLAQHIHTAIMSQPHPDPFDEIAIKKLAEFAASIYGDFPEMVMKYAHKVRNESNKRQAESQLLSLIGECQKYGNDTSQIATSCLQLADKLTGSVEDFQAGLSDLMARAVQNAESGEMQKPLPTPWSNLNRVLKGGMVPGELVILAARPGMGKTALAGCIAVETARSGKPVLFISREVKDITIANRLIAREGRIDQTAFRQFADRAPNIMDKIRDAAGQLSSLPLSVVEKSIAPMSPREVRRLAKSIKGIGLIVVDYLQLLCPDTKSPSREREVAEMSRSMKQLALDCNCPVLLLSQLNRSSEENKRIPRLSDLRESGAIEQDADIVMFLHADSKSVKKINMPVDAIVEKGRSSGTGSASLTFLKPFSDFVEGFTDTDTGEVVEYAENDF